MTPAQFLAAIKKKLAPAYLFLGAEAYQRRRARQALIEAAAGGGEEGIARYDLSESALVDVVDDARSLSLFASERLILVSNAEAALPKGKAAAEDEDGDAPAGSAEVLGAYLKDPSPGVTLLFEATRFDFDGDDKKKLERVRKFYACITDVVELRPWDVDDAYAEAQALARKAGLTIEPDALGLLVEALGADVARIAIEMEKMTLFAGKSRPIGIDDVTALVADARATTIFALVNALGRRDRSRSLEILDTLTREGEYLPLALAFLGTQFRIALVAREASLRSPQAIQGHFSRIGIPMWGSRAEQVYQTVAKFSGEQLRRAVQLTFEADRDLRSARPDDRIIMEQFVLALTA